MKVLWFFTEMTSTNLKPDLNWNTGFDKFQGTKIYKVFSSKDLMEKHLTR